MKTHATFVGSDWHTWIGKGNPKDFLDPPNWKDGKVPPKRGASVFVPSGSRIETLELPRGMVLKQLHVELDPKGTPPEKCTRIEKIRGRINSIVAP